MTDLVEIPLFDLPAQSPLPVAGQAEHEESYARRLTKRQQGKLAAGYHPTRPLLRLHPDAPPVDDRSAPGPRCGTCVHLVQNERDYLKCDESAMTHGPATDVRRWWPACTGYQAAAAVEVT